MTSQVAAQPKDPRDTRWSRVLFGTVLLWFFLANIFPLFDTDFWWHLRTGEWILANGTVPQVDLFTFMDSDKNWIDLHWGFQILITLLYRLGGVPLVTLVKATVYTAAVAIGWSAGGTGLPAWKKAIIWIVPMICITGRALERPEMLSMLFLATWMWFGRHTDERPKLIWYLPLVQLIWVNCHALFVLGLVVGFCYAIDAVSRELAEGRFGLMTHSAGPDFRTLWIVGGLVTLACLANPYFEEGALFPLTLYRKFSIDKAFYSVNIGEFLPPIEFVRRHGFNNIYLIAELTTWLIASASFIFLAISCRKWSPFRLLMFAGFSHLAWQANRNTNIFALVSAIVACENFGDLERLSPKSLKPSEAAKGLRWTKVLAVVMVAMCTLVVTGVWNEMGERNKPFRLGEQSNYFIHDAARFAGQPGFPELAFVANNGQAAVYDYHNGPERKVFMDARLEVCTQDTFQLFNEILTAMAHANPAWTSVFKDSTVPVVILDSRTSRGPINGMLQTPGWRLVFADRSAAVFLEAQTANKLNLSPADPTPLIYPDGPPKPKK